MLCHFFQAPARIREIRSNPFAALIEGFADYMFPGKRQTHRVPDKAFFLCGEKSVWDSEIAGSQRARVRITICSA